ncbi:hypothetical protein PAMA_015167 [Pampus argenteus]
MDLSLLPTPVSEHNREMAEAHFTVRSANSPSYRLTRRPGVRKPNAFSEEERESAEETTERWTYRKYTGTNGAKKEGDMVTEYQARTGSSEKGQCEEKETSGHKLTMLNHNGTADKAITDFGVDRTRNPASESQGRTEWRRFDLTSKSKSLDTGARSFDQGTQPPDMSSKQEGDISKQGKVGVEGVRDSVMSSMKACNSGTSNIQDRIPKSYTNQGLGRFSRGHSLPSRLKSQFGPSSGFRETASIGPKEGQSISERIEKLFGKTEEYSKIRNFSCDGEAQATMSHRKGSSPDFPVSPQQRTYEKASGGTFPRRFSSDEKKSLSPVKSRKSFTWETQKDTLVSDNSLSPKTRRSNERTQGGRWQDHNHSRYSEEGGVKWDRELVEMGTRSLDRDRARHTIAAQIRSTRAAGRIAAPSQSNTFLEGASETRKRRASGVQLTSSDTDEDVFESNQQSIRTKTVERKTFPDKSAAGVRNKINQFEALTQKSQGLATGQVLMPRRTFSMPTQLSRAHDGVRKSGSAKAIGEQRHKWEGLREGGQKAETMTGVRKKLGPERSLSMDRFGLRVGNTAIGGNGFVEREEKSTDRDKNCADDFGKYSRLKHTLEIPLNGEAQQRRRNFYIDETDFSKVSKPEEAGDKDMRDTSTGSLQSLVQKMTPTVVTSPISDDDKTPTGTPNHSPFISPQNPTPTAESENKNISISTQTTKTPKQDSLPLLLTTASPSNLPNIISPDARTACPKGKKQVLDLNAWLAGLNSKIKVWNDDDDDYEDDDKSMQKDEDSNYDSDSGESSVTITSNMSQSDRRSFCVSLSYLCNFAGVDCESENDSDDWQSPGRRSASLSSDMSALSCVSVIPSEELDRLLEDVRGLGDNTLQDYDDVQVVVLHKEVGVGLGFSVAGGVDQSKPITVHKVFHSGVAAQEGSIREGDQVLSINGTALCDYAHWEALRVLRRAKTREMGVVVLRRGGASNILKGGTQINNQGPTQTQITEKGQCVCVRLAKNNRDLGFSLEGGIGSSQGNRPLTVQKIFQGGPFDKVCPGDELVEIEGVSVLGMRRLEAWTLIRQLPPGLVDVVLRRPVKQLET